MGFSGAVAPILLDTLAREYEAGLGLAHVVRRRHRRQPFPELDSGLRRMRQPQQ